MVNNESGLRRHRIEFVRETITDDGLHVPPADPQWLRFSDVVRASEASVDPAIEEQRGIGSPDVQNFFRGPEEAEWSITYDLQQWFTDGGGQPLDAAYDGIARDIDNLLPNTHTVVDREAKDRVAVNSTWERSQTRATNLYTVMNGGFIDEVTLTGDPGDQQPIGVELSYAGELIRTYQVDQPEDEALSAVSTDDTDTTQSVTLANEAGDNTTTLALDGTTPVSTDAVTYNGLDVVALDAETKGDVEITTAGGDVLTIIGGRDTNEGVQGDLGIPATGAGAHASAIAQPYEQFLGDEIQRAGGPLAMDINSYEFTVSNNTEYNVREDGFRQRVQVGDREVEVGTSVAGETTSHDSWQEALQKVVGDLDWTLTGGTLTAPEAALTDVGDKSYETGQAAMTPENTFTGKGVALDGGAV